MTQRFKRPTNVQSIIFDRTLWTVAEARKWLREHDRKVPAVDSTDDYHRFRQAPPSRFTKGTFRTILFGKRGIKAVIGVPKANRTRVKRNPTPSKKPWLPALLVELAIVKSIDLEGGQELRFPRSGKFVLASTRSGTELWILSKAGGKSVRTTDDKGEKLYEAFTGFEHDSVGTMVNRSPRKMQRLGRAMNIVYRSDKFSSPGRFSDYVHAFKHYPTVSVDNLNRPTIVALRGGKIHVRKEGITG